MPPCGVRAGAPHIKYGSPRSVCWIVLQNLFTEEPDLWIPRLSPDGLWREARRGILGALPIGALLLQPAQTAPFSWAGRKEEFLFVNSSYALWASFLPPLPPAPKLCLFWQGAKSGQGSCGSSRQDGPPQPPWANFPGQWESPCKGTWSQI